MFEQIILVLLFIGLMSLVSLSCGLFLCALVQLVCHGFDVVTRKYSEMVSEINNKLGDDNDEH